MNSFVSSLRLFALFLTAGVVLGQPFATAQERPQRPTEVPGQTPAGTSPPPPRPTPPKPGALKPYKDVVTAEAKTEKGVFTVHRIEDKLLFEIPESALNREMLWQTEIAQLPAGFGYPGTAVGNRVVRWTRRNNKVYLRNVDFTLRSTEKGAIQKAIESASLEPIIAAFDVETEGEGKAAVIDVTRLFTSDPQEFSARQALGATGVDPSRSYVEKVKAFPTNIETRSTITYVLGPPAPGGTGRPARRPGNLSSATALIHYSLVMLPDKPMMGRYFDNRIGYFAVGYQDYGTKENRVVEKQYITRYRLEKKDPNAALSEPVKPIVYYISREVPERWRSWMKKGVEQWQPAFEAAGFKNAIICKEAPSEKEDPDWDPEDARYSVIRWAPMPIANAMGPHVHDPRSGEIVSAHIIMWHDVLRLAEMWYFVQCACLDPRAAKLPLPEALAGELLQYVVAHEVGHTLGLRHNHKASSAFTIAQLRSKEFTEKWGNEASIMDYGRFNYVAQPGDGARLIPKIGPYDFFAIEWGYRPILSARTPDEEKPELDRLAARQVSDPTLRFGGEDTNGVIADPTVQTEDLGDDPIEATTLGLKNINRIAQMLVPATTKVGEDYSLLQEVYGELIQQRQTELFHVLKLVGGVVETRYHGGRGGEPFQAVPRAKQAQAVKFLVTNALTTPQSLLLPAILNRIEPSGVADRVLGMQRSVLNGLFNEGRIRRLMDQQALLPGRSYTVSDLVADVQGGVWSELAQANPRIDLYRRNLQRAYVQLMKPVLSGETPTQTELRPIGTGALRELAAQLDRAIPKTTDRETLLHLRDCRAAIERILNPKQ
jgi:hypothetical protein